MPLVQLNFNPALLLLVLSCPLWQLGHSVPVMGRGSMTECVLYARAMLQNITDALAQKNLFSGINCTEQSVDMDTSISSVCAPKGAKCSESEFHEEMCLTNIKQDLIHYYKFLAVQPDPDAILHKTVLFSLRELMENCFALTRPTELASAHRPISFDERLILCKRLKGFQVRTITINRVIGYINSGDHTK